MDNEEKLKRENEELKDEIDKLRQSVSYYEKLYNESKNTIIFLENKLKKNEIEIEKDIINDILELSGSDYILLDNVKNLIENNRLNKNYINCRDKYLCTPLHILCANENINEELLKYYIKSGAKINERNILNKTPFNYLCGNNNININLLKCYMESNIYIEFYNDNDGEKNPLHILARNMKLNVILMEYVIMYLMKTNDDYYNILIKKNNDGENPLYILSTNPFLTIDEKIEIIKVIKRYYKYTDILEVINDIKLKCVNKSDEKNKLVIELIKIDD